MGLPMLKEFLCGCSIKSGALIIGWIHLINSLLGVLPVLVYTDIYYQLPENKEREFIDWIANKTEYNIYGNETVPYNQHVEDREIVQHTLGVFVTVMILTGLFNITSSLMLIFGVHKKNTCLMLPWLIWVGKTCAITLLSLVIWIMIMPFASISVHGNFMAEVYGKAMLTGILFFVFAIPAYSFLVVYTYYRTAKYEKNQLDNSFQKL